MNTAIKSNIYHLPPRNNEITKSGPVATGKKAVLLDKLSKVIRLKHYSKATEQAYSGYVLDFIDFRAKRQLQSHGTQAIEEYLTYLAVEKRVAASTQNVAFNALFPAWKPLVDNWPELERLYMKGLESKDGKAQELYERMQVLNDEGRIIDGWKQTGKGSWSRE